MKNVQQLLDRAREKDRVALAKLITAVESGRPEMWPILRAAWAAAGTAHVVGITGPPGAGKSTLVDRLIRHLRAEGATVGVIAVDPSSPFSGGAVLGDRIRMQDHFLDDGVFIRSLSTRGRHGGLARATRDVARLLDAFGLDVILVETVGVGQTELDIMRVADTTLVVLVPESGDTIQVMKAGLLEIADVFVVNKADREGADRIAAELEGMLALAPGERSWEVPVLLTEAHRDVGIAELLEVVRRHRGVARPRDGTQRRQEVYELVADEVASRLHAAFENGTFGDVLEGSTDPYTAAESVLGAPERLTRALGDSGQGRS